MRIEYENLEAISVCVTYDSYMYYRIIIESCLLPIIVPATWVITGSTIIRMKVNKCGGKSFYVHTITEMIYYSMDKYLTRLLDV